MSYSPPSLVNFSHLIPDFLSLLRKLHTNRLSFHLGIAQIAIGSIKLCELVNTCNTGERETNPKKQAGEDLVGHSWQKLGSDSTVKKLLAQI